LLDHVERLKMPTLVLGGGRDRLLPFKPVPAWTRRLPDGELEVIERCGHMLIIEDPERVVARMLAFLRRDAQRTFAVKSASQAS
jgi:pimeloyl-ACP methyl ester carboxylesterase